MNRTCKLSEDKKTLTIVQGDLVTVYAVDDLCPDHAVANPAYRLTKGDGVFHDVMVDEWGPSCTCGAFTFKNYHSEPCKHIEALRAWGLLPGRN